MTGADFALMALLGSQFGAFENYVQAVKKENPEDEKRINQIALLTQDMVIHYEQAVVLGTTQDYEENTKIWHFNSFLKAADEKCEDIDLATCIYELVCSDSIPHNLATRQMPCN